MNRNENEREEYDMCQALQEICDERESIGFNKGMEKGIEALILTCKSLDCTREGTKQQLKQMFELENDEAIKKVDLYW